MSQAPKTEVSTWGEITNQQRLLLSGQLGHSKTYFPSLRTMLILLRLYSTSKTYSCASAGWNWNPSHIAEKLLVSEHVNKWNFDKLRRSRSLVSIALTKIRILPSRESCNITHIAMAKRSREIRYKTSNGMCSWEQAWRRANSRSVNAKRRRPGAHLKGRLIEKFNAPLELLRKAVTTCRSRSVWQSFALPNIHNYPGQYCFYIFRLKSSLPSQSRP